VYGLFDGFLASKLLAACLMTKGGKHKLVESLNVPSNKQAQQLIFIIKREIRTHLKHKYIQIQKHK
jgi:hypothetical protein